MTKFYIQTIKDGIEYEIPEKVIKAIRSAYGLTNDTEIVFCATIPADDKIAAKEGRALRFEAIRDIAETACETELVSKVTEPIVTNETPVETPEKNNNSEEEIKMAKMPKELGKTIRMAVGEIIAKYTKPLTESKGAYETARDTLKKVRETETNAVKTAKETFDSTEKGTVARKIAGLDLKAARDHKKIAVGKAKLAYDKAKLAYDELVAAMNDAVAEVTRSLIGEYQPVTAILAADDKHSDEPAKEEQAAKEQTAEEPTKEEPVEKNETPVEDPKGIVAEVVEEKDFGTSGDDKTGDAAALPKKTFAVLSFGNVGNKVEAFRTKILASKKYAWKEVKDWKHAELIRVYTQAGAKITSDESAELKAILEMKKAAPDRVHFDSVNA